MLGDDPISRALDGFFGGLENVLEVIIKFIADTIFSNQIVTILMFYIFINIIAIVLMKKDKQYAETPGARRVRESTLLTVALVGGGIGEYYAMFKYKHKTLHKNFLYIVPFTIALHVAMYSYLMFVKIMG